MKLAAGLAGMVVASSLAATMPAKESARRTVNYRHFEFSYVTHIPELRPGAHTMKIWIPIPPSSAHQQITNVRIASPLTYRIEEDGNYGNEFAYFEFSTAARRGPFEIRLTFEVQREEYKVILPPGDPAASRTFSPAVARFLQPDRLVPIDGVIGEISQEQTRGISDPLAKAHALYGYVLRNMHYDHAGTGWGRGDAVWACSSHHGNCTDFHSLFIGLARAAGIPARFDIGFALPAEAQGKIGGYHCWAEFYMQVIGWIPVDAAEASQTQARRDYFFGALDENRVRFSRGRALRLNPKQTGAPVNYLVYPYADLDGKPVAGIIPNFSYRNLAAPAR